MTDPLVPKPVVTEPDSTPPAAARARGVPRPPPGPDPRSPRCPWRWWLALLLVTLVALPLDPLVVDLADGLPLAGGDLRRSLSVLREYGQITFIVLVALVIWTIDPDRRRWLLDWLAAMLLTGVATVTLKVLLARPRPSLDDPYGFGGPFRRFDLGAMGQRYSWEVLEPTVAAVWSMPSNHAAYAAIMSVFLARHYPRLTNMVVVLAVIVGVGRVAAGAHYPSDVAAGLLIGWAVTWPVVHRGWGVRALDWLWVRLVNPNATPAYPALARAEAGRTASRTGRRTGRRTVAEAADPRV